MPALQKGRCKQQETVASGTEIAPGPRGLAALKAQGEGEIRVGKWSAYSGTRLDQHK